MKSPPSPYWVLVADGGCARIFQLKKAPAEFQEVKKLVSKTRHQPSREMISDASGRVPAVPGVSSGHVVQPRSDAHDLAEQEFSGKLAETLERAAQKNVFERLVVFADPKTLGRLRPQMSKALSERITKEVNHDLVEMPLDALEKRVRAELGWSD